MNKYFTILLALLGTAIIVGCGSDPGTRQLDEGIEALRSGEYVLAKTWFENAINETSDPDLKMRAYNYLGVASWRLNELQQAVADFKAAREISPDFKPAICNLGLVALETGSKQEAVTLIEEAAMLKEDQQTLEYLALAYMRSSRWAEARRTYLEAIKLAPESARLLTATGLAEFKLERYQEASDLWEKAFGLNKKYAPAIFNLAVLRFMVDGDSEEGDKLIKRFSEIAGPDQRLDQIEMLRNLGKRQIGGETTSTVVAGKDGEQDLLENARAKRKSAGSMAALNLCLQEAIAARRVGDDMRQLEALQIASVVCFDQARAHYALGRYYLQRGEVDKATRSLRQAVAISPESAVAQIAFAECSIMAENFDAALISLRKALQIEENNPEALWMLAQLYDENMGDSAAALATYRKFAKLFPGDPRSLKAHKFVERLTQEVAKTKQAESVTTGSGDDQNSQPRISGQSAEDAMRSASAAQMNGRLDAAVRDYRKATRLDPSSTRAWFNLGVSYGALDRDKEAAEAYLQVLKLQPNHLSARFNLALSEYKRDDYSKAVSALEKVLKKEPDHSKSHFLLGVIYAEKLGNPRLAKQHYRRFLQLSPNDSNASAVRSWLNQH